MVIELMSMTDKSNIVLLLREEHLGNYMHRHKLLQQLLRSIGDIHLIYFSRLHKQRTTLVQRVHLYSFLLILATAINPQLEHTWILNLSETKNSLSLKKSLIPCDMIQSLSIYPNLKPPPLLRPCVGCLVIATTGPRYLAYILSSTRCLSLW